MSLLLIVWLFDEWIAWQLHQIFYSLAVYFWLALISKPVNKIEICLKGVMPLTNLSAKFYAQFWHKFSLSRRVFLNQKQYLAKILQLLVLLISTL